MCECQDDLADPMPHLVKLLAYIHEVCLSGWDSFGAWGPSVR